MENRLFMGTKSLNIFAFLAFTTLWPVNQMRVPIEKEIRIPKAGGSVLIEGEVSNIFAETIPGIEVCLSKDGLRCADFVAKTSTDTAGRYRIEIAVAGNYSLTIMYLDKRSHMEYLPDIGEKISLRRTD